MTPDETTAFVKSHAASLGFDRVGVARAEPLPRAAYYRDWLARGHAGTMKYLSESVESRLDPRRLVEGARSIICTAINYRRIDGEGSTGSETGAVSAPGGRIAQYARGEDYHVVIRGMLERLVQALRAAVDAPFGARVCVDTLPLVERELAAAAGIGWIGKNTLVMHEALGSYLFLGEIVTTLELTPDSPVTDHCGTCTRCLEACPTQAFTGPYQMDASRCISYLTIEHRGAVDPGLASSVGDWLFGCDICQEVCPHNTKAPAGVAPRLMAERLPPRVELGPLLALTHGGHRRLTRGTAARRASRGMWRRNAAIVAANQPESPARGEQGAKSDGNS